MRPSEDELIATLFAPMAGPGGLGLQDDAALITPPPGRDLVVTVDALVAGVHFFPDDPAASIARKALAVNLSDLAAKGAAPLGFLLALALPADWTLLWLRAFTDGLAAAAGGANCPLIGGDTVRTTGPLSVSITALGTVPVGRMVRRTGARPGDRIYVSGTIGDGALGLLLHPDSGEPPVALRGLSGEARAFLLDRYRHPQPRLDLAALLVRHAGAAMDISDGLIGDLAKMLRASGVGGRIDLAEVPLSEAARACVAADPTLLGRVVTGGDDYEILAAVPAGEAAAFETSAARAGIRVTAVGVAREAPGLETLDVHGRPWAVGNDAFQHF